MADFGISLGIGVGLNLLSSAFQPPQEVGKLESKDLPSAAYDALLPKGYGLIPFRAVLSHVPAALTESKNTRGKIGGKVIEYSYSATMQFLVLDGKSIALPYLTMNGDPFVDFFAEGDRDLKDSTDNYNSLTIRLGTEGQSPIGALEAIAPDGIAPPNRGITHITLPNWPLTEKLGNRPPLIQGLAATAGELRELNYTDQFPRPIDWDAATEPSLAIEPHTTFTESKGHDIPFPAARQTYHIMAITPDIRLNLPPDPIDQSVDAYMLLLYDQIGEQWTLNGQPSTSMDLDHFNTGVFFDIEIDESSFKLWINGNLAADLTLPANTYTLQINSTEWAGTQTSDAQPEVINQFVPQLVPLKDILIDICDQAGIPANADEITDGVMGISLRGESPKDWLAQLQAIYAFIIIDKGGTLYFLNGDRPPESTIDASLEDFGLNEQDLYSIERKYTEELPYECEVLYYDLDDHQEKTVYYRRDSHDASDRPLSDQKIRIETGSVMTAREATGIAKLTLTRAYYEKHLINLESTFQFYHLEPGDVIRLPLFNSSIELLILEASLTANYQTQFKAVVYSREAWKAKRTPEIDAPQVTQQATFPARLFAAKDLPQIRGSHPTDPLYLAISNQRPAYGRAAIFASVDDGNSFREVLTQEGFARVGISGKLPAGTGTDTTNRVIVRTNGILDTLTTSTFNRNSRVNQMVIGDEVVQFRSAQLLGRYEIWRYYALSTLKRSRLSTPNNTHVLHERVALIEDLQVVSLSEIADSGEPFQLEIATDNRLSLLPALELTA